MPFSALLSKPSCVTLPSGTSALPSTSAGAVQNGIRTSDLGPTKVRTVRGFRGSGRVSLSKRSTYSSRALVNAVPSRYDHDVPAMRAGVPAVAS